jgi:subtilase family serine protease
MACNSFVRLLPRLLLSATVCTAAFAGVGVASAQAHARITTPITGSGFVAIAHSIQPRAKLGTDLGPMAEDTPLHGMSIRFNMTDAQQAALDQLLSDQLNPSSPRYHQWLTPAQYGAQFGMSAADLAKVSAWLTAQGFTITGVANGGTFITFDGTVGLAQSAFATSIHTLSVNGATRFANVTDVSMPSAFAGTVAAVTGLHDFKFKSRMHSSVVNPEFTSSVSPGNHFIAPGDLYTIYNMNPLLNSGMNGSGVGTGANCHSVGSPAGSAAPSCGDIAVTGQVDINTADVSAFRSASGLNTSNLPVVIHAGTDPGAARTCTNCTPSQDDLDESSLDVEWAGAMAPSATIDFVTGVDVFANSLTYAIDTNLAPIITTSYGLCEASSGSNEMLSLNALFKQANAQGQTILTATGDDGATDCDAGPTATQGLVADFPGSSPYVTAMGGTQFNEGDATGVTSYWSGTNGTVGQGSAVSYIPESTWNDETLGSYGGGGGGASAFFTKPVWQTGTGVPADGSRDEPDLALDASNGHDPLLYCVSSSCVVGYRVAANGTLTVAGGTSFDSQIFGGMLALIEQKIVSRIGNANPTIYALANNSTYYTPGANTLTSSSVVFNDVTTGNNSQPCQSGTPNCGNGGVIGFTAGLGYDQATGWGSVNLTNLANAWKLVTPLGIGSFGANISVTTLTASPSSVAAGSSVTLTANVTGSAATPTGTVQFFANGVALSSLISVPANGIVTYSWVTSCSALGQQVLSASYSGDVNYQGSKGPALAANGSIKTSPVEVQVTSSSCPDFALSTTTPSISVAAGGTIPSVTITATPSNGFTGMVSFSAVSSSTTGYAPTFSFSPSSATINSGTAVTTTLTLSGITAELRPPTAPGAGKTPWYAAGSGIAVASLLLLILPGRRRLGGLLLAVLAVALMGGATGCGSSQSGPPTTPVNTNAQAGTYIVTVTATYTSSNNQVTQHTTAITYSIN